MRTGKHPTLSAVFFATLVKNSREGVGTTVHSHSVPAEYLGILTILERTPPERANLLPPASPSHIRKKTRSSTSNTQKTGDAYDRSYNSRLTLFYGIPSKTAYGQGEIL